MKPDSEKPKSEPAGPKPDFFFVKMPAAPQVGSAEADKTEQLLLAKYKARGPRGETLKPLAVFYSRVGQQERAYQYLKMWMRHAQDKNELAECLLMSGQLAEQVGQPEPAISFYQEALAQKPTDFITHYYIHNNLAFCLNARGEFKKAVSHCESAIALDPSRANAFKNMGIAFAGLGQYAEAARTWVRAIHVDASDKRALELLETLLREHREQILAGIPDIDEQLASCKRAATTAQSGRFADWAKGLTLN